MSNTDTTIVEVRVNCPKGKPQTFWRAAIEFTPGWEKYDLTDEQLKRVKAEPMLEVREPGAKTPKNENPGGGSHGGPPQDHGDRQKAIIDAINKLDPKVEEDFTKTGKPTTEAIEKVLGWSISAAERDEAWETIRVNGVIKAIEDAKSLDALKEALPDGEKNKSVFDVYKAKKKALKG